MRQAREERKAERLEDLFARLGAETDLRRFAEALLSRAPAEDLAPYAPGDLAAVVGEAWERLQTRRLGRPRVHVADAPAGEGALESVTIVEVLNDNMPFLVDSVMGELTESGLTVRLVLHPILTVRRDASGTLLALAGTGPAHDGESRESLIHIHVGRIAAEGERAGLARRLEATLADVRAAVADWRSMIARIDRLIADFRTNPPPLPLDEADEAVQFLQWLRDDNFTFLGLREYVYRDAEGGRLERGGEPGLGILRNPELRVLRRGSEAVNDSAEMKDFLKSTRALVVTKANIRSRVHRRVHTDHVGVKLYDAEGRLSGELRIIGLFTSTAYTRSTRTIPYVRQKVDRTVAQAGFDPTSHSGKALLNVLESYPRDELFQIDDRTLYDFALQILALDEHPRVRVLARRDTFDRFVSVLVYVPRDRYSTEVRIRIGEHLEKAFSGRVAAWQPAFPEGSLARVHFIVGRYAGRTPSVTQDELETAVTGIVRTWTDALQSAIGATPGGGEELFPRYRGAFGAAYREAYPAATALADIRILERLQDGRRIAIDVFRRSGDPAERAALKLYSLGEPVPLSDRVPVLENMGLRVIDERTYRIAPEGRPEVHLHDMTLERAGGGEVPLADGADRRLEALFMAVWYGAVENDGFNALGLSAGLGFRDIALIRAYARYLRQIGIPYALDYMAGALVREPTTAARLSALFEARFDPHAGGDRAAREAAIAAEIETALDAVSSLDDDTIIRRLLNAIRSTLRTNAFRIAPDGRPPETFALKLDSRAVTAMPDPKPFREIWVYGPRVEGIHMRFGKVARGGLRWSDRPQDFRTEVLGLVKAQQVKNAVIVPAGAKGGFVPKRLKPHMARDAWLAEGTEAYRVFVSTLLSVTDNLSPAGEVLPPDLVVRHEGDDPYLVVAADKGTATFSDTANAIALEQGFWLGDAFASGGSAGYDHKKMAITARGAFEAVKRHFREMDRNILAEPFTVAGVGDMSGDVFGNGMLLARTTRLVAAFDHRDIFIDPDPDPETSWAERKRLFDLPRSSWADYDPAKLSRGGGVHSRSLKAIELSAEARALLGLAEERPTPQAVMRAILKLDVDLLWFGGIGTYVRAASETDAAVGDRANDPIRVTAEELRAKVIGEGANLGVTQAGRIAYARRGGRCNSDAIDNSGGVNSSDQEVNIKIALGQAVRSGRLDLPDRNALLAAMTDEVAGLVLANNESQTLSISLTARRGLEDFGYQRRLMQSLEKAGQLNRAVEGLPDDAELARREKAREPLTRPEIGVLLAYAKMTLKEALIESGVPDDGFLASELAAYFPSRMRADFADEIRAHRLRREIVTTRLANAMIDQGGATLVTRISDQTGADAPAVARAFLAARVAFALDGLDQAVGLLDNRVRGALQLDLYGAAQDLLLGAMVWFLRNVDLGAGVGAVAERFRPGIEALAPQLPALLPKPLAETARRRSDALAGEGVPEDLARRVGHLAAEAAIPDIVLVSERARIGLEPAAAAYFGVAGRFRIGRLLEQSRAIPIVDYYEALALDRARGQLADAHRSIAVMAMGDGQGLDGWLAHRTAEVERTLAAVEEITGAETPTVSRFAVAAGLVADLAKA
ncbi:NAD-glutamate dehydrogenase [Prosthecomicrobium sp. N25]|uniref:NAD-glutamate dehydrogenase n=1 Tax=Prosthecomicrobium sp. N25 TaxID=3129254 RepID=UPI0030769219